jgi:exopolyphosphatase/guanosine-5'-triphosphate,3'-diphosphate pyrophosphatase
LALGVGQAGGWPARRDDRRGAIGLQPERADVILAGAFIVATVMTQLGRSTLSVSDPGPAPRRTPERFGG